jgi:hypothetical protein
MAPQHCLFPGTVALKTTYCNQEYIESNFYMRNKSYVPPTTPSNRTVPELSGPPSWQCCMTSGVLTFLDRIMLMHSFNLLSKNWHDVLIWRWFGHAQIIGVALSPSSLYLYHHLSSTLGNPWCIPSLNSYPFSVWLMIDILIHMRYAYRVSFSM